MTLPKAVKETLATTSSTGASGVACCCLEDRAGDRRQDRRGRREEHVEVAPPACHLLAAEQLQLAGGQHVVIGADLAAQLALMGDVRLDRRPVDALVVGQAALVSTMNGGIISSEIVGTSTSSTT